jgi:hypothetical protein
MLETSVRYNIITFLYTCEMDGYSREAGGELHWYYLYKTECSSTHDTLCNSAGIFCIKNKESENIYQYYCDSINQTSVIFTKTYKSGTT